MLLVAASLGLGCGRSSRLPTIPVSGKVTYEDGSPVPANSIELQFLTPQKLVEQKNFPHAAVARVNTRDGTFSEMTTWQHGDGAIAGEHVVVVSRAGDERDPGAVVPREYRGDRVHPNKVFVAPDENVFHITIPKD